MPLMRSAILRFLTKSPQLPSSEKRGRQAEPHLLVSVAATSTSPGIAPSDA